MRRSLTAFVTFLVLTNLMFVTVLAGVTVEYLGPLTTTPTLNIVPQGDFILGHTGDPVHLITDFEVYNAYSRCSILEPLANGCTCASGYTINSYSLIIAKTGSDTLETTLPMSLGHAYRLDRFPPETVCFDPPGGLSSPRYQAPFFCGSEDVFTVGLEGFYKVTITAVDECGCIYLDYTQALHIPLFSNGWGSELFLVADDNPGHCPDYYVNPSMGYLWYSEIAVPGNIVMWADATCCDNPVSSDRESWGNVKALYR